MRSTLLVLGALAALLLPRGWGLVVAPAAACAGARRREVLGLALLGAAGPFGAWRAARAGAPPFDDARGWSVHGTWRQPPGAGQSLQTRAGPLAARLDAGVRAPTAGTPVRALVRRTPGAAARIVSVQPLGPPAGAWLDRWAAAAGERAHRVAPRAGEGLVTALVLGRRDGLPPSLGRDCIATGTAHLLALSGLHVSLLAGLLGLALGPRAAWASGIALACFVLLAGSRPPLVRAALGWVLVRLCGVRGRAAPPLHRLMSVGLLMEAGAPGLHAELSAQLSFVAVGGLLGAVRLVRGPWALFAGGAGACLATAPLCAEVFGRVAPFGVLVTPLLVPLVAVILGVGFLPIVAGGPFGALDGVAGPLLGHAAALMERLLGALASAAPAPLHPAPLPVPGWAASLAIVASLALLSAWRAPEDRLSRQVA